MAIVDYWNNPLTVAPTLVIGYRGDIEEFPHDLYSFLLSSIREADQDDVMLLWRWLQPMQSHWESQYADILTVMKLQSPELCPAEFLDYLRKDVGIMDDLGYIWGVLTESEKRRFIKYFVRFLRYRGTSFGASEMISTMTGHETNVLNYFYYRWVVSGDEDSEVETAIGREDDGYDPWLISEANLPVGEIPNLVVHGTVDGETQYAFEIDNLVDATDELPIPEWVFIKFLGTNTTTRAKVAIHPSTGNYIAYPILGEVFEQASSSLSDEPANFRTAWESDEYVFDILMEDDGELNRDMVVGLTRFSRPLSERVYIRYYSVIELFETDDFWTTDNGTATFGTNEVELADVSNVTRLRLTKTGADQFDDYVTIVKMKSGTVEKYSRIYFMYQDIDNTYYLEIEPATPPTIPAGTWSIVQVIAGTPTTLDSGNLDWLDVDVDYVWRIESFTSTRPGGEVQIIRVYQDENIIVDVVDDPAPWSGNVLGTIVLAVEDGGSLTASRVLIHPFPMEFDYVGP